MKQIRNIHFVGVGGIGMSGIARILTELGFSVTGSDVNPNGICARLEAAGAVVYHGHHPDNINGADLVVRSSAIGDDNCEIMQAVQKGVPVIQRAKMLGMLMNSQVGIAIAGTHGKTTTSAMIATILETAGLDPTCVIGGIVDKFQANWKLGYGNYLVAEADESDGSLIELNPHIAVVTNIDDDHLDYYGNKENLKRTFVHFLDKIDPNGWGIVSADCATIAELRPRISRPLFTYGIENNADLNAINISEGDFKTCFDVILHGEKLGRICLTIPGRFNILNALAAIAVGLKLDISFDIIHRSLESFRSVKRRFELIAALQNGIKIYDDYAHHPSEVRATLDSARNSHEGRVISVFQPHRYTRTQKIGINFGAAFKSADEIIVTDIYSAGEEPIDHVDAKIIVKAIRKKAHGKVTYIPDVKKVGEYLEGKLKPNDLLITLGAGDVYKVAYELADKLKVAEQGVYTA